MKKEAARFRPRLLQQNKNLDLIFLVLLAGFCSFYKLSVRNFWCDEAMNYLLSFNFSSELKFTYPPLYPTLLHFVTQFSQNEFFLRLSSALFGIFSVIVFYFFAFRLAGRKVAMLSAVLLTLSPLRIWYSQEASPHIMAFCLVLSAIYSFYLFTSEATVRNLFFWSLFNLLSFYTSNYSLLLLPAQALYLLLVRKELGGFFIKKYTQGLFIQLVLFLPQIHILLDALSFIGKGFWIPGPSFNSLRYTVMNFLLGYNGTVLTYDLAFAIFCLVLILAFFSPVPKKILWLFISFGVFPLLTIYAFHFFLRVYLDRNNLIFMPLFFLIISAVILAIRTRIIRVAFLCLLVGLMIHSVINYFRDVMPLAGHQAYISGVYIKKNVTNIIDQIKKEYSVNDILAVSSPGIVGPVYFYAPKDMKIYYLFAEDDNYWTRGMNSYKPKNFPESKLLFVTTDWGKILFMDSLASQEAALEFLPSRVWLLQSSWSRSGCLEDNAKSVEKTLKKRYVPVQKKWIEGVLVSLYIKNNALPVR